MTLIGTTAAGTTTGAATNDDIPPDEEADIVRRFADAGIVLPADRKLGALQSAQAILAATHWMRQPRTAAAEPSNIFALKGAIK